MLAFIGFLMLICLATMAFGFLFLIIQLIRGKEVKKILLSIILGFASLIVLSLIVGAFFPEETEQVEEETPEKGIAENTEESYYETQIETEAEQTITVSKDRETEQTIEDSTEEETQETETSPTTECVVESTLSEEELFVQDLSAILDKDVAQSLYDILVNQIGFTGVKYIGPNDVGNTNYDFESNEYDFTVTARDEVYRVFQPNGGATFYEDGEVKHTISDIENRKIDSMARIQYYDIAKEIVKANLKSPKSADFPTLMFSSSDIAMQRNGDMVAVQSYVDSQNSFGAMVRSKWTVEFLVIDMDSFSYQTIYINIDGKTSGEFIDLN